MMTIAEVFLLIWALGATGIALYCYRDADIAKRIIFDILNDEDLRNHMVSRHNSILKQTDAR